MRFAEAIGQVGALRRVLPGPRLLPRGWTPNGLADAAMDRLPSGRAPLVVEVGAWCGRSTVVLGEVVRERGGELVSVDTWLGAPEFWLEHRGKPTHDLHRVDGYPTVYHEWARNVVAHGLADTVTPFPISSLQGAEVFRRLHQPGLVPDLVYLDGAHEYEQVRADLRAWCDVLSDDGFVLGDDYSDAWPGVVRAARDYATDTGRDLVTFPSGLWSLGPPNGYRRLQAT